jgi:aquaporin Z
MNALKMSARLGAEFLGTFWLVFGGCGSAAIAAKFVSNPGLFPLGIGFVGVALSFGLTVLTMAYAVSYVSGAHFNPAVTIGLAVARRFEWKDAPAYVGTQMVAGLVAGGLLELIASGKPGFAATGNMAANGYGIHSPPGVTVSSRPWSPRFC